MDFSKSMFAMKQFERVGEGLSFGIGVLQGRNVYGAIPLLLCTLKTATAIDQVLEIVSSKTAICLFI